MVAHPEESVTQTVQEIHHPRHSREPPKLDNALPAVIDHALVVDQADALLRACFIRYVCVCLGVRVCACVCVCMVGSGMCVVCCVLCFLCFLCVSARARALCACVVLLSSPPANL